MRLRLGVYCIVFVTLVGCAGGSSGARSPAHYSMTPSEARAFLVEWRTNHGTQSSPQPDPTSVAEVLSILLSDEVGRFEGAVRFMDGKQGPEALTLRALLELSWSDGYTTVADVFAELGRRKSLEAKQLEDRQTAGRELTSDEESTLEALRANIDEMAKAQGACDSLAAEHLRAGGALAQEAVTQGSPGAGAPAETLAFYQLLNDDWGRFDRTIQTVRQSDPDAPMLHYLTALESLHRFALQKEAREGLAEALRVEPKFVRAQAKLVLLQDDIEHTYAALTELEKLSPRHPIINLVGKLIKEEYETSMALRQAQAAHAN